GGGGGHPAGEERRVVRSFQRRQLPLRGADGGVAVAPVLLALDVAGEVPLDLGGVRERVGGRPDDRRSDGVERLLAGFPAVHGERPWVRFGGAVIGHGGQPSRPPRWLKKSPAA